MSRSRVSLPAFGIAALLLFSPCGFAEDLPSQVLSLRDAVTSTISKRPEFEAAAQVRDQLLSCAAKRRIRKPFSKVPALLEVRPNEIDEVFGQLVRRRGAVIGSKQVQTYVVFEHFGHETVDPATDVRQEHENVRAIVARGQGTFDGVDLSANAFDTRNQLLFFFVNM
jgi:hypothetical protein